MAAQWRYATAPHRHHALHWLRLVRGRLPAEGVEPAAQRYAKAFGAARPAGLHRLPTVRTALSVRRDQHVRWGEGLSERIA